MAMPTVGVVERTVNYLRVGTTFRTVEKQGLQKDSKTVEIWEARIRRVEGQTLPKETRGENFLEKQGLQTVEKKTEGQRLEITGLASVTKMGRIVINFDAGLNGRKNVYANVEEGLFVFH